MPAVSGLVNRKRRVECNLSELLGLAKGMLADGVVNDKEADYLVKWGLNRPDGLDQWPTGSRPRLGLGTPIGLARRMTGGSVRVGVRIG